ncbi:polyhomeotic [Bombyx mori]|uniref:Polyhomeotic n=1 Tax=Bombyx mori TaxID=7091 RepID=E5RWY0_BOMMO|nr:polyhomeotic [Bombyx mori]BAJ54074.1 polyhomeotic [Bombyx mori]
MDFGCRAYRFLYQPVHTQQFNVPGIGEINLSFLASPQSNVNLLYDKNHKPGMSGEIKPQQIVEGQPQVVQHQLSMAQHEPSQQHHQTVTVVSSMPSNMASHQVQQQQTGGGIQQQSNAGITTMPPLQSLPSNAQHPQQLSAEWGHSRVQVIQQPLPNNAYLQQLYNTQGPLLMPGNIALHPGINSQQIQVIAAGKPFQGNQLGPHMLTTQGKQVLQGQAAPFPGYTTIPAIPTTQNQTFVFSSNILPAHSQPTVSGITQQQKQSDMHKCGGKVTGGKVANANAGGNQTVPVQAQCVQVSQPVLSAQQPAQAQIIGPLQTGGQTMQFAPWQISGALPQVWAGGLQAGTLPAGGLLTPNPIFIRGTQPDAPPSMFIQHSPQNTVHHNSVSVACATPTTAKPRASADGISKAPRPLSNILPSGGIRPNSNVSTQTNANQAQNQAKQRGKPGVRSPAPANKQDAANQTNKMQHQIQQPKQQLLVMNSSGQMAQITSVQDKQALNKNLQQQALLQQQIQQQQQSSVQQQQLLHQQQTQQMVQHYQQQGMTLGMQQGTQTLPIAGMPQTISMVQQIHPLGAMGQAGTIVGQLNTTQTAQNTQMTQVQTLQQQPQTLVGNGLVQTSVGMAVQQQTTLSHATPMQAGAVGLIAAPVQGSVMPMQTSTAMVAHVKTEDDKSQQAATPAPVQQIAPQQQMVAESTTDAAVSATPIISSAASVPNNTAAVTTVTTADASISTSTCMGPPPPPDAKPILSKKEIVSVADSTPSSVSPSVSNNSTSVASSAQQTTPILPQLVTTSSVSASTMTSVTTASVASGTSTMFKSTQCTPRHISQAAAHDKGLPKAMVKPNILTHVIEGYVIQEAGEPFAVNRPLREWADKEDKENKLPSSDEPPRKKQMLEGGASLPRISSSNDNHVSESSTRDANVKAEASSNVEMADSQPTSADSAQAKIPNANKWTVAEVCEFIRNIPGCAGYADEFLMQEVDGEALLLIKPEHLVMALSMKLGPALKIVACIDSLRPESEQNLHDHD